MDLRHEWKHRLSPADLPRLRRRLLLLTQPDPHAVEGRYHIRSLYFDTPSDKALREKLDGVNRREKFRIRCYNKDPSLIHLEKRASGTAWAERTRPPDPGAGASPVGGGSELDAGGGKPPGPGALPQDEAPGPAARTLVDYTREPFVYPPGNVRVTLDYDLARAWAAWTF